MHTCHAKGCGTPVPPKMFMCRPHWYMLDQKMQSSIWALYRPGQEVDKQPSALYLRVAQQCIDYVYDKEQRRGRATNLPGHHQATLL